jgi:L-fucose mutarotase
MLKRMLSLLNADLRWILAAMGCGDELAVVDRNFPAHALARGTTSGKLVTLGGVSASRAIAGRLEP